MVSSITIRVSSIVLVASVAVVVDAQVFNVALWGDMPYTGQAIDVFTDPASIGDETAGYYYSALVDDINESGAVFVAHTGDVKAGSNTCGELNYKRFEDISNAFTVPAFLTLGDNGWTDCYRLSAGNYDPLDRLDVMRKRFFHPGGHIVMGTPTDGFPNVTNKRKMPENQRFVYSNVMFVLTHVAGSNNNKYTTPEVPADKSCDPFLDIIDPGCRMALAEFENRDAVVNKWVKKSFSKAKKGNNAAVMIIIQANIFGGPCGSEGCDPTSETIVVRDGFINFWEMLKVEATKFGGPVALIHGDFHFYQEFIPEPTIPNLKAVQVPGSSDIGWVLAEIDTQSELVFTFTHVDLTP